MPASVVAAAKTPKRSVRAFMASPGRATCVPRARRAAAQTLRRSPPGPSGRPGPEGCSEPLTMSDTFSIENKNVIVTGGALGIGFGIAKRFAEAGANVLIADVQESAAFGAA